MTVLTSTWAQRWLLNCADLISEARVELIELDRAIGDADHGENLDRGFSAVREMIHYRCPDGGVDAVVREAAMTLMSTVGGAAGPLYGTAFVRAARAAGTDVDAVGCAEMLAGAVAGIQMRGRAMEGEKTMLDVWGPAARAAANAVARGYDDPVDIWRVAASAAEEGARATIGLLATKGRASYLGERSIGHRDPGAQSSALIIAAAASAAEEEL